MAPLELQEYCIPNRRRSTGGASNRRAVALGGTLADTYRTTVAEIVNRPGRLGGVPAGRTKKERRL